MITIVPQLVRMSTVVILGRSGRRGTKGSLRATIDSWFRGMQQASMHEDLSGGGGSVGTLASGRCGAQPTLRWFNLAD
jgi:hypothetical protein